MSAVQILVTATAVGLPIAMLARRWLVRKEDTADTREDAAAVASAESPVPAPQKAKPKRRKAKASSGTDAAADDHAEVDEASMPVIPVGSECWHRASQQVVSVVKVHYDDLPPYYTIRFADGAEKGTVRSKLETAEERQAAEKRVAEQRAQAVADAMAAELIAEEANATRRKQGKRGR